MQSPIAWQEHLRQALRESLRSEDKPTKIYSMVLDDVEQLVLDEVLDYCQHNHTQAAKLLGISRSTLLRKIHSG